MSQYSKTIETVFEIALTELKDTNPAARKLLDIIAFLNPGSISAALLSPSIAIDASYTTNSELNFRYVPRMGKIQVVVTKAFTQPYRNKSFSAQTAVSSKKAR